MSSDRNIELRNRLVPRDIRNEREQEERSDLSKDPSSTSSRTKGSASRRGNSVGARGSSREEENREENIENPPSVINVPQVQQGDELETLRRQMKELTTRNRMLEKERNERSVPLQTPIQYQQQLPPYQYNWPQHVGNYSYYSHERTPPITPPVGIQMQGQRIHPREVQPAPPRVEPTVTPTSSGEPHRREPEVETPQRRSQNVGPGIARYNRTQLNISRNLMSTSMREKIELQQIKQLQMNRPILKELEDNHIKNFLEEMEVYGRRMSQRGIVFDLVDHIDIKLHPKLQQQVQIENEEELRTYLQRLAKKQMEVFHYTVLKKMLNCKFNEHEKPTGQAIDEAANFLREITKHTKCKEGEEKAAMRQFLGRLPKYLFKHDPKFAVESEGLISIPKVLAYLQKIPTAGINLDFLAQNVETRKGRFGRRQNREGQRFHKDDARRLRIRERNKTYSLTKQIPDDVKKQKEDTKKPPNSYGDWKRTNKTNEKHNYRRFNQPRGELRARQMNAEDQTEEYQEMTVSENEIYDEYDTLSDSQSEEVETNHVQTNNKEKEKYNFYAKNTEGRWKKIKGIFDSGATHTVASFKQFQPFIHKMEKSKLQKASTASKEELRILGCTRVDVKVRHEGKMFKLRNLLVHLMDTAKWDKLFIGEDALQQMKIMPEHSLKQFHGKTISLRARAINISRCILRTISGDPDECPRDAPIASNARGANIPNDRPPKMEQMEKDTTKNKKRRIFQEQEKEDEEYYTEDSLNTNLEIPDSDNESDISENSVNTCVELTWDIEAQLKTERRQDELTFTEKDLKKQIEIYLEELEALVLDCKVFAPSQMTKIEQKSQRLNHDNNTYDYPKTENDIELHEFMQKRQRPER